ncbi:unnamed protein product, partial [Rotaria sordida]
PYVEPKTPPLTPESYGAPHLERADSVRLLPMKKKVQKDTDHAASTNGPEHERKYSDANDEEVREITGRQQNEGNTYTSTSLPDRGKFLDAHGGQKQASDSDRKSSISTQKDLSLPDTHHGSLGGIETASFESISTTGAQYSSAFVDQQAAKSIGREQI